MNISIPEKWKFTRAAKWEPTIPYWLIDMDAANLGKFINHPGFDTEDIDQFHAMVQRLRYSQSLFACARSSDRIARSMEFTLYGSMLGFIAPIFFGILLNGKLSFEPMWFQYMQFSMMYVFAYIGLFYCRRRYRQDRAATSEYWRVVRMREKFFHDKAKGKA